MDREVWQKVPTNFTAEVDDRHCARLGVHFAEGRATAAPTLSNLQGGGAAWEANGDGLHAVTNNDNTNDKDG